MAILALAIVFSSLAITYIIYPNFFGYGEKLVIFHAGSLEYPLSLLEEEFEKAHPGVEVVREASGSRLAAMKIRDLGRRADLLLVADYLVIEQILFPKNLSNWYLLFASNKMVLAYTDRSRYSDEIDSSNWFKILNKSDVVWGHSDPNLDPAGYRALLVLKLAEIYYNVTGLYEDLMKGSNRVVKPKSVDLIALLETGQIDYAFEYESVAKQHNLKYVKLPEEINLGNETYNNFYSKANITLSDGSIVFGEVISYALTIPTNARNVDLAIEFIEFMLSKKGRQIFENSSQPIFKKLWGKNLEKMPKKLLNYLEKQNLIEKLILLNQATYLTYSREAAELL